MTELPKYKKVYEALRKQIAERIFVSGDLLPSENQLCATYRATRPTVRKALDQLVEDGFILKHQGKGSIVKGAPKNIGILSLSDTISTIREMPHTKVLTSPDIREWDHAFGFPISEQEQKSGCIYFERLRFLNNTPLFFDIMMLPNIKLPNFTSVDLADKSLFDLLRTHYRINVIGGTQQIFAIQADKRLQEYFHIQIGHPVLQLNRKIETSRDGFYIYNQVFCITDVYGLTGIF